jgi:hypothetical protein|tara:strand:+ start:329 stop:589 length:261 start_codon:yes stop_codon:yes gene_type:complete
VKVEMFEREWEAKPITYKQKRELWQLSLIAFKEEGQDEKDYFKLMNKVEEFSGLTEKDFTDLSMGQIDLVLQQVFTQYMGLEKKDS